MLSVEFSEEITILETGVNSSFPGARGPEATMHAHSLRVDCLKGYSVVGGVPREQKMLTGHLPRVMYHQVY